jgi:hypothetical protein
MVTKSGMHLADVIKKAIADHKITQAEHDEIIKIAMEDYILDDHEKSLMKDLLDMIENGTIKRIP